MPTPVSCVSCVCMFESVRRSCSCEFVVPGSWRKRTETTNPHEITRTKKEHEIGDFVCFVVTLFPKPNHELHEASLKEMTTKVNYVVRLPTTSERAVASPIIYLLSLGPSSGAAE